MYHLIQRYGCVTINDNDTITFLLPLIFRDPLHLNVNA
jgi:hypothetical protein